MQDLEIIKGYVPGYDSTLGHEFVGMVAACQSNSSLVGKRVVCSCFVLLVGFAMSSVAQTLSPCRLERSTAPALPSSTQTLSWYATMPQSVQCWASLLAMVPWQSTCACRQTTYTLSPTTCQPSTPHLQSPWLQPAALWSSR